MRIGVVIGINIFVRQCSAAVRGQIYFRKIEQVSSKNKNIFRAIEAVKKTGEPVRILVNFH